MGELTFNTQDLEKILPKDGFFVTDENHVLYLGKDKIDIPNVDIDELLSDGGNLANVPPILGGADNPNK